MFGKWFGYAKVWCLVAAVILVGGACGGDGGGTATRGLEEMHEVRLLLPAPEGPGYYPIAVARDQGYFEEEGISVTAQPTDGSDFVVQQIVSGNEDFGIATAGSDVAAFSKDPTLRVVSCFTQQLIFRLVVPAGSEVDEVSDLAGQSLGVVEIGSGEVPYAEAIVGDAGLTPGQDVDLLAVGGGGPQTRQAIDNGTIAAYMGSYNDINLLKEQGVELEDITPDKFGAIPGSCFVTRQDVLDDSEKREVLIGLARAFAKGTLFGITDAEAAFEITCEAHPSSCAERERSLVYLAETARLAVPSDASVPVGGIDESGWHTASQVFFEAGIVDEEVDISGLIDSEDVNDVRDEITRFDTEAVKKAAQEY